MIGYAPAEQAIRDARGEPYATGMDDEATWHDHARDQQQIGVAA